MRTGRGEPINWRRVWLIVLILYPVIQHFTCVMMSYQVV